MGDEAEVSTSGRRNETYPMCENKITTCVFLCGRERPSEREALFQLETLLSFLQMTSFHVPFHVMAHLSEISIHTFIYSFFFSFCLSSLLISRLAIDAYLVMTPCWFRPGSSRRKLTAEDTETPDQILNHINSWPALVNVHFHYHTVLVWHINCIFKSTVQIFPLTFNTDFIILSKKKKKKKGVFSDSL